MIEARALPRDLAIEEPVSALQAVSHDPSLTHRPAARRPAADRLDLQWMYLRAGAEVRRGRGGDEPTSRPPTCCGRWAEVLDRARRSTRCAAPTGWTGWPSCGCWRATGERDGLDWGDARLELVDLQYSDVRPDKGLYNRLVARGRDAAAAHRRRGDPGDDRAAGGHPGVLPRAGACAATRPRSPRRRWDSVIFDVGRENLVRIPTMEPLRGTREHVGALFESSSTAQELVDTITGG